MLLDSLESFCEDSVYVTEFKSAGDLCTHTEKFRETDGQTFLRAQTKNPTSILKCCKSEISRDLIKGVVHPEVKKSANIYLPSCSFKPI